MLPQSNRSGVVCPVTGTCTSDTADVSIRIHRQIEVGKGTAFQSAGLSLKLLSHWAYWSSSPPITIPLPPTPCTDLPGPACSWRLLLHGDRWNNPGLAAMARLHTLLRHLLQQLESSQRHQNTRSWQCPALLGLHLNTVEGLVQLNLVSSHLPEAIACTFCQHLLYYKKKHSFQLRRLNKPSRDTLEILWMTDCVLGVTGSACCTAKSTTQNSVSTPQF